MDNGGCGGGGDGGLKMTSRKRRYEKEDEDRGLDQEGTIVEMEMTTLVIEVPRGVGGTTNEEEEGVVKKDTNEGSFCASASAQTHSPHPLVNENVEKEMDSGEGLMKMMMMTTKEEDSDRDWTSDEMEISTSVFGNSRPMGVTPNDEDGENDLTVSESPSFASPHPLMIPLVVEKLVSFLSKADLLSARRVCSDWAPLSTAEYLSRESVEKTMGINKVHVDRFIELMTSSPMIPVVRWRLDLSSSTHNLPHPYDPAPVVLLRFLKFIAPSAVKITFELEALVISNLVWERKKQISLGLEQLMEMLMNNDFPPISRLQCLDLGCGSTFVTNESTRQSRLYKDAMGLLLQKIVLGARNLVNFGCTVSPAQAEMPNTTALVHLIKSLPKGLKILRFNSMGNFLIPYEQLMTCGFHLEELADINSTLLLNNSMVPFLNQQKSTLKCLRYDKLEALFRANSLTFPILPSLQVVSTAAEVNPRFQYLHAFPNLVEFVIVKKWGSDKDDNDVQTNICSLPQFPRVRRLFIYRWGYTPRVPHGVANLELFSRSFPNLSLLSLYNGTDNMARNLGVIFAHFRSLESLSISFIPSEPRQNDLESTIAGIPSHVCDRMTAADAFDDSFLDEDTFGSNNGLTNLKKLRTLKIKGQPFQYAYIFTPVTIHRAFMRMESLKEICFVKEAHIPDACEPFLEAFRTRGIDLFRVKR